MNFVVRRPGQPFAEYMTAVFASLIVDLRRDGVEPGQVRLDVDVTDRSDEEILLTSRHAAGLGLAGVRLVDGRVPARQGTVPRALLAPVAAESMAVARAHRLLGGR